MKKLLLFLLAFMLLVQSVPLFAEEELEIGLSFMPLHFVPKGGDEVAKDDERNENLDYVEQKDFMEEWLLGFHFAYNWDFIYVSLDSMVLPPWMVMDMTSHEELDQDDNPIWVPGFDRPGFFNFIDAGIKIKIGKMVGFGEIGINHLYVYRESELPPEEKAKMGSLGTNLRIGGSYMIADGISVGLTATAIFPNFKTMGAAISGLFDPDYAEAAKQIQLMPMLMVNMYL